MQSILMHGHVGPDGALELKLPPAFADVEVEVEVKVGAPSPPTKPAPPMQDWPEGYFERVFGCLEKTPMEIPQDTAIKPEDIQ